MVKKEINFKDLSLALLYAVAHHFLCGGTEVSFRTLMEAIAEAKGMGATAQEIRRALEKADAATRGQQSAEAAARLKELLSG